MGGEDALRETQVTQASLDSFIGLAREKGASDLHLEPGMPVTIRARGALVSIADKVDAKTLQAMAREILSGERWADFCARHSADLSKTVRGVRCRINIMHSARGIGFCIRLLSSFVASTKKLNLHPDLSKLMQNSHGLILISGATGAGKSSTMAALLQEINLTEARHIITIESPIEYALTPKMSFIRQREVGRDTPSFEQALIDAMREDPDVLMVGEMRDPETMRLTLNASETGHLVLATVHSSTCAEALQRVVGSFPPETQSAVCSQLADALVAVVCQRLHFREKQKISVPELEILMATTPVRSIVRSGGFAKLQTALETGGQEGNWTFARYRDWLDRRSDWYIPGPNHKEPPPPDLEGEWDNEQSLTRTVPLPTHTPPTSAPLPPPPGVAGADVQRRAPPRAGGPAGEVLIIEESADPAAIMAEMERKHRGK